MGYAYDVPVDGQWSPYWAASSRRADRDAFNTVKAGGSFMSVPAKTLFRYLGYTVPTEVFKGVYGIAQGIVDDFLTTVSNPVEVAQEGGLLGGAAVGAGIGATAGLIGGPLAPVTSAAGAIVGGLVGGAAGFFGDLFDDDEEEEGLWENIVGALSPIDEIKSGDAKHLFSALSTVMTASAILKTGTLAAQGVKAAGATGLNREAFRMAAKGTVEPGLVGTLTKSALKRPVLGSAALGGVIDAAPELFTGDFGQAVKDFGRGAAIGAVAGPLARKSKLVNKGIDKAIAGIEAAPLMRMVKSPAGQVTQALYTGAAAPTIVARGIGEISKAGGAEGIAVQQDIENAPDLGVAGTVMDWTLGAVIYPERLLPWRGKDVANAMKGLSSNHELLPVARAIASQKKIPLNDAFNEAKDLLGKNHATGEYEPLLVSVRSTNAYYQKGLDDAANEVMKTAKSVPDEPLKRQAMFAETRARIHAEVLEEADDLANIATSPKAAAIIEKAKANPQGMENYWREAIMEGSGPENASLHQKAEEFLQERAASITERATLETADVSATATKTKPAKTLTATPALKDQYLTAQDFERWGGTKADGFPVLGEYETAAIQLKRAKENLARAEKEARKAGEMFPPDSPLIKAATDAHQRFDELLSTLQKRGVIDEAQRARLAPMGPDLKVDRDFIKTLQENAKLRPREIEELSKELAQNGMDRYIAVATGENLVNYSNFSKMAEVEGITEYSRKQGFFDALASMGMPTDRLDLGRARYQSIVSHMDGKAPQLVEGMDGKDITDRLYSAVRRRYDPEFSKQFGETFEVKKGGRVVKRNVETGERRSEIFKIDPRDLTPEIIVKALDLENTVKAGVDVYDAAHQIKRALHVGSAFGADVAHPLVTARNLATSIRVNGLPGFNDFMRTTTIIPTKFALKSERFKKGSYGYLPQNLRRGHMAVQFSLNPMFDASRYVEAMAFGKMRGTNIPIKAATNPRRFIHDFAQKDGFVSPLTGRPVQDGVEATREMVQVGDRILHGRASAENFDELQYRLLGPAGMFGFNPREVEYAQAYWEASKLAAKKGRLDPEDYEKIRETVLQINQYGGKQTSFGNSAHFIFFPFLFSKKQLTAMVDFTVGAPTRNLLVHEGFRRWYEINEDESLSSKFAAFIEDKLPIAKELERLNNLAYGISPGRFFLEGIMDKEEEGKVGQALASFFLPGGVHQPIADTVGSSFEMAKHFFVPQVWMDDGSAQSKQTMLGLAERLIPIYRDIDRWFFDVEQSGSKHGLLGAQATALTGGTSPYTQMSEYLDMKKVMGASLESAAIAAGYSSWESLRAASPELAKQVNDLDLALGEEFPEGKNLSLTFSNTEEIKEQTIYAINQKDERTDAEEAISAIGMIEQQMKTVAAESGRTQEEMLRMAAPLIRQFALGFTKDRQFMNLWDSLFRGYYGPLREMVAA